MSTFEQLLDSIKKEDLKKLEELLKTSNNAIINRYDKGSNLLSYALKYKMTKKRLDIVKLLLKYGINTNGLTKGEGNTMLTPICNIQSLDYFYEILDTLLKYGFDINYYGTLFITTVCYFSTVAIDNNFSQDYYKALQYLLSKGANPNIKSSTILNVFIQTLIAQKKYKENALKFIDLFLYYDANPYLINGRGESLLDLINAVSDMPPDFKQKLNSKLFISYEDMLRDCNEPLIIKKMANAFKIPYNHSDFQNPEKLKEICECIKTIKANFSIIEFDNILELRKEMNNLVCDNEENLSYTDSINEYPVDQIYILKTGKFNHCFHKNELFELLKLKKNPYTNEILLENQIEDILKNLQYIPNTYNSLEESIEIFNKKNFVDFTLNNLIEVLSTQLTVVDSYTTWTDLKNFNSYLIYYLSKRIKDDYVANFNFFIDHKLKVESEEYLQLKLYNLIYEIIAIIASSQNYREFSVYNLSHEIRYVITLSLCKNDIVNYLEDKGIDVYNSTNQDILKTKIIKNLINYDFIMLDGSKQKFKQEWIDAVLNIILTQGGWKIEVNNLNDAEKTWNDILGYALDKY